MILAAQFESVIHPITIMISLPLAVIGAFGAQFLAGQTFSIFGMIGLIMLMSLVTKNAILLVDFAQKQKALGGLFLSVASRWATRIAAGWPDRGQPLPSDATGCLVASGVRCRPEITCTSSSARR